MGVSGCIACTNEMVLSSGSCRNVREWRGL
uniref:Uncharacterized protein n=1 Tax=Anguilla anguilla TaxID=7936 RepID=A0A0E9PGD5_ANGAN